MNTATFPLVNLLKANLVSTQSVLRSEVLFTVGTFSDFVVCFADCVHVDTDLKCTRIQMHLMAIKLHKHQYGFHLGLVPFTSTVEIEETRRSQKTISSTGVHGTLIVHNFQPEGITLADFLQTRSGGFTRFSHKVCNYAAALPGLRVNTTCGASAGPRHATWNRHYSI